MKTKIGKVYLIGAGPGDPDLITIRGFEALMKCEAVVYDNLVPAELIVRLPEDVEKHYVGKKAGQHVMSQEDINRLLVKLGHEGKIVARLKGSDPLIFGRGGEEARFLRENDIEFEIVPGITAAIGAAAYSGIPCTDREHSSYVIFATGHKAEGKEKSSVPWDRVAKCYDGTLVIYMGVAQIGYVVEQLIQGGMRADMPTAIIERGTFSSQRVVVSVLGKTPEAVSENEICPPAIFIVGPVVDLRRYIQWFEQRPLAGIRIMVTRPADQAAAIYKALRDLGAEVLPYPTIATRPVEDESEWAAFQNGIRNGGWLVFTSENGVRYFFQQFLKGQGDIRRLANFKTAVVGSGTARALDEYKIKADFIPSRATTIDLAKELAAGGRIEKVFVIRIRGNLGDDKVEKILSDNKASVKVLHVYQTYHPAWPVEFEEKLYEYPPDVITFTSGSSVKGIFSILGEKKAGALLKDRVVASIGPMTSRVLDSYGIKVTIEAREYSIPGVIQGIMEFFRNRQGE